MVKYLLFSALMLACYYTSGQPTLDGKKSLDKGNELYQKGKFREAVEQFDKCISVTPALIEAFLARAMAREQLKDYEGAVTDFSIFLEKNPDHYEALLGRANARYNAKQFEAAKKDYVNLLQLQTGETNYVMFRQSPSGGTTEVTTAQTNLQPTLLSHLGMTEYYLHNFQQAKIWLDSAIKLEPKNADFYVNRGLVMENENPQKAVEDYNAALKINPNHSLALHNLGVLNSKSSNSEDYFDKVIETDSTMLAPYLERAYMRMQSGYFKGALEDYNSAIAIEKEDPDIWLNRGYAKEKLNDLKGAYQDYTQAIALDDNFEKAWLNRGNVLAKQNKYKEAIEDYTVAISVNPEYGSAYYNRAVAKEKLKQKKEACADVMQAEKFGVAPDIKLKMSVCD